MGAVSASDSVLRLPALALCKMLRPSAKDAIIPYSMPLWTILTKCPAPLGPQCKNPNSEGAGIRVRPAVRGLEPMPGAMVAKIGWAESRGHCTEEVSPRHLSGRAEEVFRGWFPVN